MATQRDYYDILGVDKSSSADEIKKAYRKQAKKYHPDLNPDDAAAESSFKEASEAYEILSDSEKKSRYDQLGHAGVNQNGGDGGGGFGGADFGDVDLGDLFGSFFGGGGGFGGGRRANPNAPRKGADTRINVMLSFMEAAHGCEKELTTSIQDNCGKCNGSGSQNGKKTTCPECSGTGQVKVQQRTPFGVIATSKPCSRCSAQGTIITDPCKQCGGNGKVTKTKTITVKIPAGIDDEQIVSVQGRGNAGFNGGPSGDLLVVVGVRPDPLFERDGYDVWCEIPITYAQAALGDSITVPTVDGKIKYTVAAGTQPGTVFRLKGRGIQSVRGRGKGDGYVKVVVEIPKNLNNQQKEALEKFEGLLSNDTHYEKRTSFFDKLKNKFK